ncbi:MAG: methyltransferase [Candidatus Hydrogenedentota bacterium]
MDAFDRGARYYELFANAAGRLDREGPYLIDLLDRTPGKRVADLACGTGMHALFLAEHGAEVDAFDLQAGMVAQAQRERPHARVRYAVHDMREPLQGTYNLVLCLGNSLTLTGDSASVRRTLANAHSALAEGGLFVAQVLNYGLPANQKPRTRVEERSIDGNNVVAVKCLAPREAKTYLTLTYFIHSEDGVETVSEAAVQLHVDRAILSEAAQEAGFSEIEFFGGYARQAFDPGTSSDLIVVARRAA